MNSAKPAKPPEAVTVTEACRLLGVSRPTLARLIDAGKFPGAFQLTRDWRIPRSDIEAFKARKRPGRTEAAT